MSDKRDPLSMQVTDMSRKLSDELYDKAPQDTAYSGELAHMQSLLGAKQSWNYQPNLDAFRGAMPNVAMPNVDAYLSGKLSSTPIILFPVNTMTETPLTMWQREHEYRHCKLAAHEANLGITSLARSASYEIYVTEHRKVRNILAADLYEAALMVEQYAIIAEIEAADRAILRHDEGDKRRANLRKELLVDRAKRMATLERTKRKIEQRRKVAKSRKS